MSEETQVLLNLSVALALAFLGGAVAVRLRQSPLIGYLAAGIIIGPFTPGFSGDQTRIAGLADVGIIFLMFALGVEFSLEELARVRRIALLGTGLQLACTGILAGGFGLLLGWSVSASLYLGALVALSSTVVILKTLLARGEMDSVHGSVLLGILIVQDLVRRGLPGHAPRPHQQYGLLAADPGDRHWKSRPLHRRHPHPRPPRGAVVRPLGGPSRLR